MTTKDAASVALAEYTKYFGLTEDDHPLRGRIADYYEAGGGSRSLNPSLDSNAWSAAFVSFCIKQAGASRAQFSFNLAHSVFVHAAIANAAANAGVFRAYPADKYAPKIGDIVHHNRGGNNFDYNFARINSTYKSHSAIVVDHDTVAGVKYAVTIGGNESDGIRRKRFELDSSGILKPRPGAPLICVIENLLDAAPGRFVVNVSSYLSLRGGPGTTFTELKRFHNGDKVTVIAFEDNAQGRWAKVDVDNDGVYDGYMFAGFLDPV